MEKAQEILMGLLKSQFDIFKGFLKPDKIQVLVEVFPEGLLRLYSGLPEDLQKSYVIEFLSDPPLFTEDELLKMMKSVGITLENLREKGYRRSADGLEKHMKEKMKGDDEGFEKWNEEQAKAGKFDAINVKILLQKILSTGDTKESWKLFAANSVEIYKIKGVQERVEAQFQRKFDNWLSEEYEEQEEEDEEDEAHAEEREKKEQEEQKKKIEEDKFKKEFLEAIKKEKPAKAVRDGFKALIDFAYAFYRVADE